MSIRFYFLNLLHEKEISNGKGKGMDGETDRFLSADV